MVARGLRNNNPGNIIKSGIQWEGEKESLDETKFETFDTAEHGLLALCKLLLVYQDKHGCRTIRSAISRWAPPSENDTGAYVASVGASLGIDPDADVDFHDPRILAGLARAIVQVENGVQPYSAAQIDGAVAGALGIEVVTPGAAVAPQQGKGMDPLTLISIVGPVLSSLIPQVGKLFGGQKDAKNAQLVGTILDTVSQAAGTTAQGQPATLASTATAIEKMQTDPALTTTVQQAVITHPDIAPLLEVREIGGGVAGAAERGLEMQQADKPFWLNPVVWVTVAMLPIMYAIVFQTLFTLAGPYMVSNGVPNTPLQANPWFAVVGFDSNTRTGLINLIVGFVFGGVCGIWFGTTVAAKRSDAVPQAGTNGTATAKG